MVAEKTPPSQIILQQLLSYESVTGRLVWRSRPASMFSCEKYQAIWNTRFAGKSAGNVNSHGYKTVKLLGVTYRAHILIWVMAHGEAPSDQIDHINGDRLDNRLENLRIVTRSINMKNTVLSPLNTSGVAGVGWRAKENKWTATIVNERGKRVSLGYYARFEDAVSARRTAEPKFGYHPNHGRQNRVAA